MGTQLPPSQKGQSPQFSAHVYCGQTAAWNKMSFVIGLGLGLGHIVLDGNPVPVPEKGSQAQLSAHVYCAQRAE